MNRAMMSRLSALEVKAPNDSMPCFIIQFVAPGETAKEPSAYRDGSGGRWVREPDEEFDTFQDRAIAGARANALPGCGSGIIPDDDDEK